MMISQWSKEDFSYSYLVPLIVLYLLWEKKDKLKTVVSNPGWFGLAVLLSGIFLFWLGELGGEFYTIYLSSWFVLNGLLWLHLGWKKLTIIAFPVFLILTMFPPPNFIYNKLSVGLKLISTKLAVAMLQLYGMSAHREGNIIDLGFTQLQVVDACSGLRYLIPLIVLGILLAYFFKASFWKRALIVISTVPLSIITNSLRIALTGILYEIWGAKVAEGFFHGFSGWFIFMFSLTVLLLEMWVLKKVQGSRFKVQGLKRQDVGGLGGLEAGKQASIQNSKFKIQNIVSPPQFIVAVVLLGATLAFSQGIEFRENIPISKPLNQFPLTVDEWTGTWQSMEQKYIDALDLSDYMIIDYQDRIGRDVNLYVAYYESQRKGESIHSPATCLTGSGWIFNKAGQITIPVPAREGSFMLVNRAFMQKTGHKQLVYYWFAQRGRILTNAYQLKIFTFWDALTKQRTDGALVRVITPVYESEQPEDAEARLQAFVNDIDPFIGEYVPGKDV